MSAISSLVCSNLFRNGFFQCLPSISTIITPLQLKTRNRSLTVLSNEDELVPTYSTRRRTLNVSILTVLLSIPLSSFAIAMGEVLELERYTDSAEGFTLLKPSSWSKESTKEAEVVSVSERTGEGGLQVYEFEYKVDSTRGGLKRILSAAFVASGKLYLLNIAHSDGLESPIDPDRRNTLEQILHSFDIAPST